MQNSKLLKVRYTINLALYNDFLESVIYKYHKVDCENYFFVNKNDTENEIEITLFTHSNLTTKGLPEWTLIKQTWVITKVYYTKAETVTLFINGECKFYSEPYYELTNCAVCNEPIETIITSDNVMEPELCLECEQYG